MSSLSDAGFVPSRHDAKYVMHLSPVDPYSQRTWICAKEIGVPFMEHVVESRKDTKKMEIRRLSPRGKLPIIECGRDVVYGSMQCNAYLVNRFFEEGGQHLFPDDPMLRARTLMMSQQSDEFAMRLIAYIKNRYSKREEGLKNTMVHNLRVLDDMIAQNKREHRGGAWLVGTSFGLGDIAFFPMVEHAAAILPEIKSWSVKDLQLTHLEEWYEQCADRPSIRGMMKTPSQIRDTYKKCLHLQKKQKAGSPSGSSDEYTSWGTSSSSSSEDEGGSATGKHKKPGMAQRLKEKIGGHHHDDRSTVI